MELNEQIVSLEIAKRLKQLDFEQESLWYWINNDELHNDEKGWSIESRLFKTGMSLSETIKKKRLEFYSAYTVVELLIIYDEDINLPKAIDHANYIAKKIIEKHTN